MPNVYLISAVRTPIGRFGGSLKDISPAELGSHVMKAALEQAGLSGRELDLYIFGNVLRAGHGQLVPRQAAGRAGIPAQIDGYAVDMVCSSGMMAVINAAAMIKAGEADLILAGGIETMSQAGFYLSHRARWGYKFLLGAPEQLQDILLYDGLTDPIANEGMGRQTERLAAEYNLTRAEVDEVAYLSHRRAAEATAQGYFKKEIVPFEIKTRQNTNILDYDEGIRADTTLEALAQLHPVFDPAGILTAGNSSQISDGAAALLIAGEAALKKHRLQPMARLLGGTWAAVDSWRFAEAPIPAVKKLLAKLNKTIADFDLIENNEAFGAQSVIFSKTLGVAYPKLNVYGGAIALGHPIGCSGARIMVTLLNALQERAGTLGLASLCHGTGGATAVAVERL
ncbi:MAG: thiolase family protein [Anaerolineae bacterium]|nr:thiolase family protein [Anaerolineae bacterium]